MMLIPTRLAKKSWLVPLMPMLLSSSSCCVVNDGCTLATCIDGLQINVTDLPESPVEITAAGGDGNQRAAQCEAHELCGVVFEGFHPETVVITVMVDGRSRVQTFTPSYDRNRPNGLCCPPTCHHAIVEVGLPQ